MDPAAAVADAAGRIAETVSNGGTGARGRSARFSGEAEHPMIPTRLNSALERAVDAVGKAWAVDCSNTLHGEGRSVSGGWPGTLSEARSRVALCLAQRGTSQRVSSDELEVLARRAYASARKAWLARADVGAEG